MDPLLCPFCGAQGKTTARAIRWSLKLPVQDPDPLSRAPPKALELIP